MTPDFTAPAPDLFEAFFDLAVVGGMLFAPVRDAAKQVVDFTYVRLNPAAQQMLALPECPAESFLTLYPHALTTGVFAFYREAFASGAPRRGEFNYQHDGLDNYFHLAARRVGERLVVSFTDTSEQPRSAVEVALRESQAAEQAARAEAERQRGELERVFEQAPLAIAVYRGPTYTIELANPTVARLWGRTREQLLGKGLFEALPEVAGLGYEELLDGVMATGVPHVAHAMEAQHDRNGHRETVYWDFVYVPMYAAEGHIDGAMVVATEVTAQVRARQQVEQLNQELESRVQERTRQLGEQQQLLRHILRQVPAAVATLSGPEHRFSFANAMCQHLVANRATLGTRVADALPEVAEQGFLNLLDQVYASGQPFIGREVALILESDATPAQTQYLDFTYQPLTDEQGRVEGILAFVVDVTEQVRARRQTDTLQRAVLATAQRQAQQRQELYQIVEQAAVAIVLLREPDHRIEYHNPAFTALFPPDEWPGSTLQGHAITEVYPHLKVAGLLAMLDCVFDTGETRTVLDMPLTELQPGSPRYITLTYQAYREQERIVGVAAFAYDVTEQVLARQQVLRLNEQLATINQELHVSNRQLTRTNADLDTFVYTASHDLKAPIANIEGLLEVLSEYLPPAAQEPMVPRLMGMMQAAIVRFQQTVGHLTDVSHLQQAPDQALEEVDLAGLVEGVRLDLLPLLESTQAQLLVDVAACPSLQFAPKNLRSIVYNLVSNAVKYRAPHRPPVVQVRSHYAAQQAVLEVQDNGLGLDEVQQGKLFTLFKRLHTHVDGSGVGLYMVKRLVENAGGTIAVHSQPGVGSTFTATLPAA